MTITDDRKERKKKSGTISTIAFFFLSDHPFTHSFIKYI